MVPNPIGESAGFLLTPPRLSSGLEDTLHRADVDTCVACTLVALERQRKAENELFLGWWDVAIE
jgi:hypothetical protein